MQQLIDVIIQNLLKFWPIARVYTWNRALLVRAGRIRRELPPGLHWRWPFLDEVKQYAGTLQSRDLKTAAVQTLDGKSIAVSANIGFRVVSLERLWHTMWDIENTLPQIALGHVAKLCAARTWNDIERNRETVELEIVNTLATEAEHWGIHIEHVHLTDAIPTKAWRFYLDNMYK